MENRKKKTLEHAESNQALAPDIKLTPWHQSSSKKVTAYQRLTAHRRSCTDQKLCLNFKFYKF